MAKRILVPIDRSTTAASACALVADLARGSGASVRLLLVEPPAGNVVDDSGRVITYASQEMASQESDGLDYLRTVAFAMGRDLPIEVVMRFGDPVKEILRDAADYVADLIVVGTAARCGIRRPLVGSVAEAVLRRADIPVLLHRAAA